MSIGEKIYNLRKKNNLSQEDLAGVLNVSRQTISKWETGESLPDFDKIVPLCDYFKIRTDDLLKGTLEEIEEIEREDETEQKRKKAFVICSCIAILTLIIVLSVIFEETGSDTLDGIVVTTGFGLIGIILVYYFITKPIINEKPKRRVEQTKIKLIHSIVMSITFIMYFVISFTFRNWSTSWLIFFIGALISKIVRLCLMLGSEDNEE